MSTLQDMGETVGRAAWGNGPPCRVARRPCNMKFDAKTLLVTSQTNASSRDNGPEIDGRCIFTKNVFALNF